MFKVEHNVPDVYVNESRDFQLFSRLYDLVFQSCRYSIDSMQNLSDTMRCNDKVLPLIATKVGFFTDLNLTSEADRKILSAFPHIVKYKGSMNGIILVTNLFERIMNTSIYVSIDDNDRSHITIVFVEYLPDVKLLYSLLEYIRPVGVLIDYVVRNEVLVDADLVVSDRVTYNKIQISESNTIVPVYSDKHSKHASTVGFAQVNS